MQSDEVRRALRRFGKSRDRQCRGIAGEDRRRRHRFFGGACRAGLDGAVLEHGFDDDIGVFELIVARRRRDLRENAVAFFSCQPSLLNLLFQLLRGIGLAFFGRGLGLIDQNDFKPGLSRDMRDPRAHHSRAENTYLAIGL